MGNANRAATVRQTESADQRADIDLSRIVVDDLSRSRRNEVIVLAARKVPNHDMPVSILLTGASGSGKSTIFKQMNLIYGGKSLMRAQREEIVTFIMQDVIKSLLILLNFNDQGRKNHDVAIANQSDDQLESARLSLRNFLADWEDFHAMQLLDLGRLIASVYNSEVFQILLKRFCSSKFRASLMINFDYFCSKADLIFRSDYLPTEEDYLRWNVRTLGLSRQEFVYRNIGSLHVIDVGGVFNERKKWSLAYADFQSIRGQKILMHVVSASCFDEPSFDDVRVNGMKDSMIILGRLFQTLQVNEEQEKTLDLILIVNKVDLLERKLLGYIHQGVDLCSFFPELKSQFNMDTSFVNTAENLAIVRDSVLRVIQNRLELVAPKKPTTIYFVSTLDKTSFATSFEDIGSRGLVKQIVRHRQSKIQPSNSTIVW